VLDTVTVLGRTATK